MPNPWDDLPIESAPPVGGHPWDSLPVEGSAVSQQMPSSYHPHGADSFTEALQAGWQSSATGLIARGKLPDIVLDPAHVTFMQKLAAGGAQIVSEIPEMMAGGAIGGAAAGALGIETGPLEAAVIPAGAGAGALALPTVIRASLMQAYSKGAVANSSDFFDRVKFVAKATTKDAVIGALSGGMGAIAGRMVGSAARGIEMGGAAVEGPLTAQAARTVGGWSTAANKVVGGTVMTFAPAAFEVSCWYIFI